MLYPYAISRESVNGHRVWIAKSLHLKGCVAQGDTRLEAIKEPGEDLLESSIRNTASRRTSPKQSKKAPAMRKVITGTFNVSFIDFLSLRYHCLYSTR